jgi:sulfopropanediol 3-dehydrogenase
VTIEYLKKAEKTAATGEDDTRKIVADMLGAIEAGGEAKAREYAEKLDGWTKDIVLSRDEIDAAIALVPSVPVPITSCPPRVPRVTPAD